MSTNRASTANGAQPAPEKSYFEQQREMLVGEIAQSLELVLQNINKLNRSLEEVTQVGAEFAPVESLWSHFENVMAKDPNENQESAQEGQTEHEEATESRGGTASAGVDAEARKDSKAHERTKLQEAAGAGPAISATAVEERKKSKRQNARRIRLSDELMGRGDSTDEVDSDSGAAPQVFEGDAWEDC